MATATKKKGKLSIQPLGDRIVVERDEIKISFNEIEELATIAAEPLGDLSERGEISFVATGSPIAIPLVAMYGIEDTQESAGEDNGNN